MKRKLSVILVIIIMMSIAVMGYTFAVSENICRLNASIAPNNPKVGEDVKVELSVSEINEGISSISVALNYDETLFTLSKVEMGNGWTYTDLLNTYFIYTTNDEPTTQTGTIVTFYLTTKTDAPKGEESEISLSSIQVATDGDPVDLNDLSQKITIYDPTPVNSQGSENKNEVKDNTVKNDVDENEVVDDQENDELDDERTKNEVNDNTIIDNSTNEIKNAKENVQKINEIGNYDIQDKNESPKSIPQTGDDFAIKTSIIGVFILAVISYIVYRKNKI